MSRQITRTKSKSGAVVKHQRIFVIYKNQMYNGILRVVVCHSIAPLSSDFPDEHNIYVCMVELWDIIHVCEYCALKQLVGCLAKKEYGIYM